jgi:spore coat polysaccharide biosynthesis protein SpsF (cytidylyltransferase family)/aryl-alcohol dehydrogenase-like predicted oxidoreductase
MNATIVMQARSTSTRLPGKALLPIGGYPCALLAGLRARNLGQRFIFATSDQPSDDALSAHFAAQRIPVFRGPLDDVLGRFVGATAHLPDESHLVRLTADNVLPDGSLIEELGRAFSERRVQYLSIESPQSRLPYGVAAEVFSVATMRKAHARATSSHDREHVTPWIRRNYTTAVFQPRALANADFSHLRCTIDDEEDYERICHLFVDVQEPIKAGWFHLVGKLQRQSGEPTFRVPYRVVQGRGHSEMALGTAQIGMDYGLTNSSGKPAHALAIKMIRHAGAHGVTALDTARDYGNAELVIGEALTGAWRSSTQVVTKLSCMDSLTAGSDDGDASAAVEESVGKSCVALGTSGLQTVLLHRADHYHAWYGAVWKTLIRMRAEARVERVGVSVYEPQDAIRLLADPDVQHLQIPMNVLDWRWKSADFQMALRNRPDVLVHARSALLQGLLTRSGESLLRLAGFDCYDGRRAIRELQALASRFGRESVVDLCLAYVRSQPWVHGVVVGCDNLEQLNENLRLFCRPHLSAEECEELEWSLPRAPRGVLNPSLWEFQREHAASC